ncbi:hypothetical protein Tco_1065434 [Tanacetum coccineum]
MPSVKSQSTDNGSKPKPRINNQNSRNWHASKTSCVSTKTMPIVEHSRNSRNFSDSKDFVCSTCQKCVFNANHDTCVTKFLNEVNSRAKVPSNKTTNKNKHVKKISIAKKLERQIPTGHRFSIKKTSTVHKKTTSPRSCLRWKQTGKIFKTVGLRWVPTGKIFTSSTTTVDNKPPHGSNTYITNLHECIKTLDSSACTSINVQEEQNLDLSAGTPSNLKKERIKALISSNNVILYYHLSHGFYPLLYNYCKILVLNCLRFIIAVIMESLVKKKQKGVILELKRRHLKNTIFCTYTPYPAMKIRRISASSAQEMRND